MEVSYSLQMGEQEKIPSPSTGILNCPLSLSYKGKEKILLNCEGKKNVFLIDRAVILG